MSVQQALIEYCIQDIVEYTVNDIGVEYDDAMKMLYESQTFEKLTDVETTSLVLKCMNTRYLN